MIFKFANILSTNMTFGWFPGPLLSGGVEDSRGHRGNLADTRLRALAALLLSSPFNTFVRAEKCLLWSHFHHAMLEDLEARSSPIIIDPPWPKSLDHVSCRYCSSQLFDARCGYKGPKGTTKYVIQKYCILMKDNINFGKGSTRPASSNIYKGGWISPPRFK